MVLRQALSGLLLLTILVSQRCSGFLGGIGQTGVREGWRRSKAISKPLRQHHHSAGRALGSSNDGDEDTDEEIEAPPLSKEEEARLREMIRQLYEPKNERKMLDPKDFPELLNIAEDDDDVEVEYRDSGEFISIFDDVELLSKGSTNGYDRNSIAMQTLREISECYGFSLSFLGDFVVELGAYTPVNIDTEICNYLTGDQIYSLLQSLNSLEPGAASEEYDNTTAEELCELLGITTKTLLRICSTEGFNLPFGMDSVLHSSVVERISECSRYDEYREANSRQKEREAESLDADVDAEDQIYGQ